MEQEFTDEGVVAEYESLAFKALVILMDLTSLVVPLHYINAQRPKASARLRHQGSSPRVRFLPMRFPQCPS